MVAYLVAGIAGAWLYAPVIAGLVRQWFIDTETSHGLLLVAIAGYAIVRRWPALRDALAIPSTLGVIALAGALLIYVVGGVMGDVFVQRVSLPMVLAASVLALAGPGVFRVLLGPIVLIALAVPLPAVLVTFITLPMQLLASQLAAGALAAAQVPVTREGNLLMLPNITLEVVAACSGLRSAVSLFSLAAACAVVAPLGRVRSVMLLLASVPVAIAGNGLRLAVTGLLATRIGDAATKGTVHETTGVVAFVFMGLALLGLLMITKPRGSARASDPLRVPA